MNDTVFRWLSSVGIPASKEPDQTGRQTSWCPWQEDKPVTWDITVVSTLAQSYLHASGHTAAGAAELAVYRKEAK